MDKVERIRFLGTFLCFVQGSLLWSVNVPPAPPGYSETSVCRDAIINADYGSLGDTWSNLKKGVGGEFAKYPHRRAKLPPEFFDIFPNIPPDKLLAFDDLHWEVNQRAVNPDMRHLGIPFDPDAKTMVPSLTGRMYYEGPDGQVRLSINLLDRNKAAPPDKRSQAGAPKAFGNITITFVDPNGKLSVEGLKAWASKLAIYSGYSTESLAPRDLNPKGQYYAVEELPAAEGKGKIIQVTFNRLALNHPKPTWLFLNIRRSLNPLDFPYQYRDSAPPKPAENATYHSGGEVRAEIWDEVERLMLESAAKGPSNSPSQNNRRNARRKPGAKKASSEETWDDEARPRRPRMKPYKRGQEGTSNE